MRRLPVYILLDCSESMIGPAIETVEEAVRTLLSTLRSDPHALETAYISLITFNHTAEQVIPLTELMDVQPPKLSVAPGTCLGKALLMLSDCMFREVRQTTADVRGDYRPIVFLLTDGQPTDEWQSVLAAIDKLNKPRIASIYAVGCGDDVDFDVLGQITDCVLKLTDFTPDGLKKLFIWLTASVQSASMGVGQGTEATLDLSKKPEEVIEVEPGSQPKYNGPPRQVFLKGYCTNTRNPYLMRYRYEPMIGGYDPVAAHPLSLEDEASGGGFQMPGINASQLNGVPPCAHCQNPTAGACGSCQSIFCLPPVPTPSVTCPKCGVTMHMGPSGGDFQVNQSAG